MVKLLTLLTTAVLYTAGVRHIVKDVKELRAFRRWLNMPSPTPVLPIHRGLSKRTTYNNPLGF
jgi:hypothetical protein